MKCGTSSHPYYDIHQQIAVTEHVKIIQISNHMGYLSAVHEEKQKKRERIKKEIGTERGKEN